jgi:hypothetical protein
MAQLYYRGMVEENGKPKVGRNARLLGVRPGKDIDIEKCLLVGSMKMGTYYQRRNVN